MSLHLLFIQGVDTQEEVSREQGKVGAKSHTNSVRTMVLQLIIKSRRKHQCLEQQWSTVSGVLHLLQLRINLT